MQISLLIAIACPTCLLIGVFLGAYLNHRADRRLSPIPDVVGVARAVIDVVFRRKAATKEQRVKMKPMRA